MYAKIKEFVISLLIILSLSFVVIHTGENRIQERLSSQRTDIDASPVAISLWYSNSQYEEYLKTAAADFETKENVEIDLKYVSPLEYMSAIEDANAKGTGPDIYVVGSEYLQNISRISAARRTETDKDYEESNFIKGTWKNMEYAKTTYGYPLGFDTAVLMYYKDKVETPATTFDEILTLIQNSPEIPPANVCCFDTDKFICNYGFVGKYADICGESGYDETNIHLNDEKMIQAATYYAEFCKQSMENVSYKETNILSEFKKGNIIYTIENSSVLKEVLESGVNVGFSVFPDLSGDLKTASLSVTDLAVVNEFSKKNDVAVKVAKYISLDFADHMYELSGILPLAKGKKVPEGSKAFYDTYEKSCSLPKVMSMVDYWSRVNDSLKLVRSGADVTETLSALNLELNAKITE